jgi:hypothetical protein
MHLVPHELLDHVIDLVVDILVDLLDLVHVDAGLLLVGTRVHELPHLGVLDAVDPVALDVVLLDVLEEGSVLEFLQVVVSLLYLELYGDVYVI